MSKAIKLKGTHKVWAYTHKPGIETLFARAGGQSQLYASGPRSANANMYALEWNPVPSSPMFNRAVFIGHYDLTYKPPARGYPEWVAPAERKEINRVMRKLIRAGCQITVHNGEDTALTRSRDEGRIRGETGHTEETYFIVWKDDKKLGFVQFVHGNGEDVVTDYSNALDALVGPLYAV